MANTHSSLTSLFNDIADQIRAKDGTSSNIVADTFPDRIAALDTDPSGDATATAGDILASKTAYAKGVKLTGTIPTKTDSGNTTLNGSTTTKSFAAGYYPNEHGATHSTTTHPAPTASGSLDTTNHVYKVTPSHTQTAGYVSDTAAKTGTPVSITSVPGATITPTESEQTAIAASRYTEGAIKVGAISSTYVGSGIARKTSSDLTASGATVTAPAGYYASAATKTIASGTLNNEATTGVTYTENTAAGTVIPSEGSLYINAGYYPNTKITLSHMIPDPETGKQNPGTGEIRSGYVAFDGAGKKIVGTMADVNPSFTGGTASLTSKSNSISTNMATATSGTYYIDATAKAKATRTAVTYNGNYTGYLDKASGTSASAANTSTEDTINATRVYVPSGAIAASGSVTTSGSGSVNPGTNTISTNTINTNVSVGTKTTTKPSSGFYVAVDASTAQNTGSINVSGTGTASATVSTAGYVPTTATGTGSVSGSGSASVTVPAKSASTTYIPITSATTSKTDATASATETKAPSASVSITNNIGTTTKPSGTAGTDYWALSASAASGKTKASVTASSASVTAGYSNGVSTSTSAASKESTETTASATRYITKSTTSKTDATATASVNKNPSASTSVTGMETTTTNTGFSVSASAASGTATAKVTASSASVGAGYNPSAVSTSTAEKSATSTEKTASDTKYIIASSVTNNTTLPSGSTSSGTINRGSYIKFAKGYNSTDKYYQAQSDAHSSYTPSSTYFQTSTTGAVSGAKINANQYATSNYYVKSTSASKSGGTVSWGSGWISSGSQTVSRSDLGITDKATATYNTSTSDQTISSGYYLTGTQTIKAVTTSGIDAANIKEGVTIKVGDANSAGRIKNVTGTLKAYEAAAFPISTSKGVYAAGYIDSTKGGSVSATTWTSSGTVSDTNLTL